MAEPRKTRSAPLIERVTEANVGASLAPKQRNGERLIQLVLLACGFLSIFTTIGIILVLANESFNFSPANSGWIPTKPSPRPLMLK